MARKVRYLPKDELPFVKYDLVEVPQGIQLVVDQVAHRQRMIAPFDHFLDFVFDISLLIFSGRRRFHVCLERELGC